MSGRRARKAATGGVSAGGPFADGVIYEVNVEVDAEIADAYRPWLDAHVREILALPGFTGARVFAIVDPAPAPGTVALCVQYALRDAAALEDYLRDHALRLRADALARFGERFRASRRVLHALSLPSPPATS